MIKLCVAILLLLVVSARAGNKQVSTIVTGLWDIKRAEFKSQHNRAFNVYLDHFKVLLGTETNLIIFGSKDLKLFVEKHRKLPNYVFVEKELEWFEKTWYNPMIEKVKKRYSETRPQWRYQQYFPHYGLYLYNTVVMTKPFLMRQALLYDRWNSDFLIWHDGGINHHFNDPQRKEIVIAPKNMAEKIAYLIPWHLDFHFWIYYKLPEYRESLSIVAASANYFTIYFQMVTDFAGVYESMLRISLQEYDMTTEQGIITKMHRRHHYLMPVVSGLPVESINHAFDVDSYFQQRTRSVRRFSFVRQFQRVAQEMQGEKEIQTPLWQKGGDTSVPQDVECGKASRHWLIPHNLAYSKAKSLKYSALFFLMLLLLFIARYRQNHQSTAYIEHETEYYLEQ